MVKTLSSVMRRRWTEAPLGESVRDQDSEMKKEALFRTGWVIPQLSGWSLEEKEGTFILIPEFPNIYGALRVRTCCIRYFHWLSLSLSFSLSLSLPPLFPSPVFSLSSPYFCVTTRQCSCLVSRYLHLILRLKKIEGWSLTKIQNISVPCVPQLPSSQAVIHLISLRYVLFGPEHQMNGILQCALFCA